MSTKATFRNVATQLRLVVVFAAAMAWVEAAVVYYLRTLVDRIQPYQTNPLPIVGQVATAEVSREAATMVMLLTVGWLAGRTWKARLGFLLVAFGAWDLFYYAFLRVMTGWPTSIIDWDVLFLIPLPWWGPVLAPALIAVLMIIGGVLLAHNDDSPEPQFWPSRWTLGFSAMGVILALLVFMSDAILAALRGRSFTDVLPQAFNWFQFLLAWMLMATPVAEMLCQYSAFATKSRVN